MTCLARFMCPLSVAGDERRCMMTELTAIPGHMGNWLFCNVLILFLLGGTNIHFLRYWIRD